jgi:hypothetical protein
MRRKVLADAPGDGQQQGRRNQKALQNVGKQQQIMRCNDRLNLRFIQTVIRHEGIKINRIGSVLEKRRQRLQGPQLCQRGKCSQPLWFPPVALGRADIEHNAAAQRSPAAGITQNEAITCQDAGRSLRDDLCELRFSCTELFGRQRDDTCGPESRTCVKMNGAPGLQGFRLC